MGRHELDERALAWARDRNRARVARMMRTARAIQITRWARQARADLDHHVVTLSRGSTTRG